MSDRPSERAWMDPTGDRPNRLVDSLVRFGALGLFSFLVNLLLTVGLHEVAGVSEELAFAVALATVFVLNFLACRYLVFGAAQAGWAGQLTGFLASSLAFRGAEYLAFLLVHTLGGVHYLPTVIGVLFCSTVGKFFFYRSFVFRPSGAALGGAGAAGAFSRTGIHLALLLTLPAIVFSNTLHNELHLDSVYRVARNPEIERVMPLLRHFTDPRTSTSLPQLVQYRPLLPLSLSINAAVGDALGLDRTVAFHIGNITLHLAVCVVLYLLLVELLVHWSRWKAPPERLRDVAFGAALLFAVHPVSGVPVNYIASRDLLLMFFFLLGSLWVYARMRRRGGGLGGWMVALLLFGASMLAKQNGVVFPAIIFLLELLLAGGSIDDRRTWQRPAAFAAVVIAFFVWTEGVLGFSDLDQLETRERSPWIHACTMLRVHLFYYLRNFVWPFRMRALPEIEVARGLLDPGVLAGGGFVLGSLGVAAALRRKAPLAAFAVVSYWLLFAPTSSVRPFRYLAADYRQYPSLAFLCLLVMMTLALLRRRTVVGGMLVVLVAYFGGSAFTINRVWRSEASLWAQSLRHGATPLARMNFAMSVVVSDPDRAEQEFLTTLREEPNNVYARINLGMLYIRQGRSEEGLQQVRRAVQMSPDWAITHYWLAEALRRTGRNDEALGASRRAADLDPRNHEYQYRAALDLQRAGRVEESLQYLERIAALSPGFKDSRFLQGYALQTIGQSAEAEALYRDLLRTDPGHVRARFNLAYALMRAGRPADAIREFEEVVRRDPSMRMAHRWLSSCYGELGDAEASARHAALAGDATPPDASGSSERDLRLGLEALERGEPERAAALFGRAAEADPRSAVAHYDRCLALIRADRVAEALPGCERAVSLAPDDTNARHNLGYAYRRSGRFDEAIAAFRTVLDSRPRSVVTWYELGVAYEESGRTAAAAEAYGQALRLQPEHAAARRRWTGLQAPP